MSPPQSPATTLPDHSLALFYFLHIIVQKYVIHLSPYLFCLFLIDVRTCTDIFCLSKVCIMPLKFYKTPALVSVFANCKKPRETLCFYKKGCKVKIAVSICFAVSQYRSSVHSERWVALPSCFPGNHTQPPSIKRPQLWTVPVSIFAWPST